MNIVIIVPENARQYAKELTGVTETVTDELGNITVSVTPSGLFDAELKDVNDNKYYISSGFFLESELNALLNSNCEYFVHFGEANDALELKGLSRVVPEEPVNTENAEEPIIPITPEEPV